MVKKHDQKGYFTSTQLKAIIDNLDGLLYSMGSSTAYIERSYLPSRLLNGRQVRKALRFSKDLEHYRSSAIWKDAY
jgi:hypothetical protein